MLTCTASLVAQDRALGKVFQHPRKLVGSGGWSVSHDNGGQYAPAHIFITVKWTHWQNSTRKQATFSTPFLLGVETPGFRLQQSTLFRLLLFPVLPSCFMFWGISVHIFGAHSSFFFAALLLFLLPLTACLLLVTVSHLLSCHLFLSSTY